MIGIYSQYIGKEFWVEKQAMIIMKEREKRTRWRNRTAWSEKHIVAFGKNEQVFIAQSAGAVEYTDSFSAEE